MKMDRLIGILSILLQREQVTAPELAEQFEVSRRTIQRDIEALGRAGIPIATAQGAGGGISIMEGYRVDRTVLTAPEMQAILAGLRSLDSVSGTRRYAQLMEKLSAGNSALVSSGAHMLIDLSSWYKSSLAPKIEAIQTAIQQHQLVQFTYDAPKGTSTRRVEPYYLVFRWSAWYLWGWCLARKEFYLPPKTPGIVTVPTMNFLAVRGHGDPNEENGAYKQAIGLLYAVAYTIKMSKMGSHKMDGYFDYVVPPLEGLWWQEGVQSVDYSRKEDFCWISLIRLPDFVTKAEFDWALQEASRKKKLNCSPVEFFTWEEGLCVQCMHIGPYDDEPATVAAMAEYAKAHGYAADFGENRFHHEIYLSDVRKCKPESLKTVVRHPVRKVEQV